MHQISIISFLLVISLPTIAQDTIRQHSGEQLVGKVIANKPYSIEFTYPGETSYNSIPKSLINAIVYASGRKEVISELVKVNGEDGWKNVVITTNSEEVVGLVRVGEVRAKANNLVNLNSVTGVDAKANEKLQKEAAMSGAHVILMLQNSSKGVTYRSTAQSFKSGIAYRYPFETIDSQLPYKGNLARRFYGIDKANADETNNASPVGKKVLFEYEGEVFEGEIVKAYGRFFKVKFNNKKGKEQNVEKHMDKVEFSTKQE
jgi:hypothetical protein